MKREVFAYAKLNLFLKVGERVDNFHKIETLIERINLFDKLVIENSKDGKIEVITKPSKDIKNIKKEENLVYKAVNLLNNNFEKRGIKIILYKNIPIGSGLGGGSSDAAVTLLKLNKIWQLKLNEDDLLNIGKEIGSDVCFFIKDTNRALCKDRGTTVLPLNSVPKKIKLHFIIVVPKIKLNTTWVYNEYDKLKIKEETNNNKLDILIKGIREHNFNLIKKNIYNSLEKVVFCYYKELSLIKELLNELGCYGAGMTGSGSAIFGIIKSKQQGEFIKNILYKNKKIKELIDKIYITTTK